MKNTSLFVAIFFCFTTTINAQFFKKLGDKVEKAAEKAILKRAERKTTKETEKAFDSTFNTKENRRENRTGNDTQNQVFGSTNTQPANSYAFKHKAAMRITSGKDTMDINYFLPESGNFLSVQMLDKRMQGDFFTVYDMDKETMFTFMENEGQKIKMGIPFKIDETTNDSSFTITETGNTKTILGYICKEYNMTGEDMTATIWVTHDIEIRFPNNFYKVKQTSNNNQNWMKDLDGWAMEMTMIDTSKRKPQTITMNCLSIEKTNFTIETSNYKNIGG